MIRISERNCLEWSFSLRFAVQSPTFTLRRAHVTLSNGLFEALSLIPAATSLKKIKRPVVFLADFAKPQGTCYTQVSSLPAINYSPVVNTSLKRTGSGTALTTSVVPKLSRHDFQHQFPFRRGVNHPPVN